MRRFIGTLLLGTGLLAPAQLLAAPPVWVLEEGDKTIYMMGTFHILREDMEWRGPVFDAAFAQADTVWLEIVGLANGADDLSGLVMEHGMSPERPLTEVLTAAERARVETALGAYDISIESIDDMRPWFAALQLTAIPLMAARFDPALSVDMMIEADAETAGKPVFAFESAEEQVMTLAGMSEDGQVDMLLATVAEMEDGGESFMAQVEHWLAGDLDVLEAESREIHSDMPEFHASVFTDRNERFTNAIEAMLDGEGVTLVAIGLGHFVGAGSIPEILEQRGYTVEVR